MSGKACLSERLVKLFEASPHFYDMVQVSFDNPFYYFTSVTHHRLPIFRTEKMKQVMSNALDDARRTSQMLFFAYVIMHDHFHIITDGNRTLADSLRYLNGVTARKIIDFLKDGGYEESLNKLRQATKKKGWQYSAWEHHSDKFLITSESMLMQKVNYIHNNPVEAGFVKKAENYLYSSARLWKGVPVDDEPLTMDNKLIKWRG